MILHQLSIFFRNLRKKLLLSVVSILSLSFAVCASLLVLNFYNYHQSFDSFNANYNSIYRVVQGYDDNGEISRLGAQTFSPVGALLKEQFAGVQEYTRLYTWVDGTIRYQDKVFDEKVHYVDPSFFEVFSINSVTGAFKTAFEEPNKIVLSQKAAKKYFGRYDVVGESMFFKDWFQEVNFEVVGVVEDIPQNAHFEIEVFVSFSSLNINPVWKGEVVNNWSSPSFYTYVMVDEGQDISYLEGELTQISRNYNAQNEANANLQFQLQPLADIHLRSNLLFEIQNNGNETTVYFLGIVGILIILIAWINLMNLTSANAIDRVKEVGIKKALGARPMQLKMQFVLEFVLLNLIALIVGVLIFVLFTTLQSGVLLETPDQLMDYRFWMVVLALYLGGTILSSLYPAFLTSKLHLNSKVESSNSPFRKGLIVFQFFVSVGLIYSSMIVFKQFDYMLEKDLGFDRENVLVLEAPSAIRDDSVYSNAIGLIKNKLNGQSGVLSVSGSSAIPGLSHKYQRDISVINSGEVVKTIPVSTDFDFNKIYNLNLLGGRYFDRSFSSDKDNIVINKTLSEQLKFDTPQAAVGAKVFFAGSQRTILGVIDDFHLEGLKESYKPLTIAMNSHPANISFLSIKVRDSQTADVLEIMKSLYTSTFDQVPEYFLVADYFNRQYSEEEKFSIQFRSLTLVAIMLTIFGLVGLSFHFILKREKEIALRKVFGASPLSIFLVLFRSFAILIFIAYLFSMPLSYFIMENWLSGYSFRVGYNMTLFINPLVITFVITLVSVGYVLIKVSKQNPIVSLREK